jgi:hypothetical protein
VVAEDVGWELLGCLLPRLAPAGGAGPDQTLDPRVLQAEVGSNAHVWQAQAATLAGRLAAAVLRALGWRELEQQVA